MCVLGSGAQWDVLQIFAWAGMIVDHARTMSVSAAVSQTRCIADRQSVALERGDADYSLFCYTSSSGGCNSAMGMQNYQKRWAAGRRSGEGRSASI